jgi:predicted AAA+ superfamily ATPase
VLVIGARQCGKSTLVRLQARDFSAEWRNLDSAVTRQAAASDPTGFVDFGELMVIVEIQRVPELLLAIKEQVDADPRPGRYMLTGSVRVLASTSGGLRALPDTLPGRTETVELWPFSQGEIDGLPDGFVDAAFTDAEALNHTSTVSRSEYAERIVRGGFPEAVARTNPARRERFFDSIRRRSGGATSASCRRSNGRRSCAPCCDSSWPARGSSWSATR